MNISDIRCTLVKQTNKFKARVLLAKKSDCTNEQLSIYNDIVAIGNFFADNFEQFEIEEIVSFLSLCTMADVVHDNLNSKEIRTRGEALLTILISDKKAILESLYGYKENSNIELDFKSSLKKLIIDLKDELTYASLLFVMNENRLKATGKFETVEPLYLQATEFIKKMLDEIERLIESNAENEIEIIGRRLCNMRRNVRAIEVMLETESLYLYNQTVSIVQNIEDDIDKQLEEGKEK